MMESRQELAFKTLMETSLKDFVNLSKEIGEPLNKMAQLVQKAFEAEYTFIHYGVNWDKQPKEADLLKEMKPILDVINEIQVFRDKNRQCQDFFNHLSAISESISALTWINVKPAPAQFIKDIKEAGEYYGNRVLTAHRGEEKHVNWVKQYNELLKGLEQYVRDHHLTGFSWGATSSKRFPGGIPPPPPPPAFSNPSQELGGDAQRFALLSELNRGIGITSMLRPVGSTERGAAAQPHVPIAAPVAPVPAAARVYPPVFLLDGRKWRIEHQKDSGRLDFRTNENWETLAMYKCENSAVQVIDKINGVSIANCKRTTVCLDDVISSVEAIRCEHLKIQCKGHCPLISIDNCDSVEVYLCDKSIDAEVISSKSTSCNICLLQPNGDYNEIPIPEQIKTVVSNGKLKSSVIEHM